MDAATSKTNSHDFNNIATDLLPRLQKGCFNVEYQMALLTGGLTVQNMKL